jgi:hypothetical protein
MARIPMRGFLFIETRVRHRGEVTKVLLRDGKPPIRRAACPPMSYSATQSRCSC